MIYVFYFSLSLFIELGQKKIKNLIFKSKLFLHLLQLRKISKCIVFTSSNKDKCCFYSIKVRKT